MRERRDEREGMKREGGGGRVVDREEDGEQKKVREVVEYLYDERKRYKGSNADCYIVQLKDKPGAYDRSAKRGLVVTYWE